MAEENGLPSQYRWRVVEPEGSRSETRDKILERTLNQLSRLGFEIFTVMPDDTIIARQPLPRRPSNKLPTEAPG